MERYYHSYRGIIVQNDDPESMGRVKVFVPEISYTLYKRWNDTKDTDKKFTEVGDNLSPLLSPEILDRLKSALPWASVKHPIFGMGTATTYHNDSHSAIIGNDCDSSTQQSLVNKKPAASLPQNNDFSGLGKALAPKASSGNSSGSGGGSTPAEQVISSSKGTQPVPNHASTINNYSNPSTTNPLSYIQNAYSSVSANINSSLVPTAFAVTSTPTGLSTAPINGNISSIEITFTPNSRNAANINRLFTSSASIEVNNAPIITGSANATGQASQKTSAFVNSSPTITVPTQLPVVAPSTSIATPTPTPVPVSVSNPIVLNLSPPLTYSIAQNTGISVASESISVSFTPNSRNAANLRRTFSTTASITVDGNTITAGGNATTSPSNTLNVSNPSITTINKNQITNINVVYLSGNVPVSFNTPALGQLGGLLQEYSNNSSAGITTMPITPPATKTATFNRGGGGGDMFSLNNSTLMPINVMMNTLVGNTNPDSKQSTNYKRPIDNGTDPNKRVGVNQQTPATCLPPMRSATQGNKVKGMVSIPAVGAHVSVYFDNGDPLYPIIDGVFYTQEITKSIHDATDSTQ